MKYLPTLAGACLVAAVTAAFAVSASAAMPVFGVDDGVRGQASLKHDVQAPMQGKRRRGPCRGGDAYDRRQRVCKGADSAAYAPGDRAAGRCKPGDRYNGRRKTCRGADRKAYPADMKQAASLDASRKAVAERRQQRRAATARKHGCNAGDVWNNRRKMCVHYYAPKR